MVESCQMEEAHHEQHSHDQAVDHSFGFKPGSTVLCFLVHEQALGDYQTTKEFHLSTFEIYICVLGGIFQTNQTQNQKHLEGDDGSGFELLECFLRRKTL